MKPGQHAPILCVVGARPNFMKIAPIMAAFADSGIPARLIHTGQHYDHAMKDTFFQQLGVPEPDEDLEVGSGSHAVQTAQVMQRFEPVLLREAPAAVLVVGDVNSTIACALVAAKCGVPVIHVEAGLRSYDRGMPEEINRVLTDQLADLLFTTERDAEANLVREGVDAGRVRFVGNVMIDTLLRNRARAVSPADTLGGDYVRLAGSAGYAVVTLHRPSNVDDPQVLADVLGSLRQASQRLPLVFPMHPRTAAKVAENGLESLLEGVAIIRRGPLSYLELLGLMAEARVVLTDSGGLQEETTALGVPCITLRENTERPITASAGTNTVVGRDRGRILAVLDEIMAGGGKAGRIPEFWDGQAAQRIAAELQRWLTAREAA